MEERIDPYGLFATTTPPRSVIQTGPEPAKVGPRVDLLYRTGPAKLLESVPTWLALLGIGLVAWKVLE